MKRYRFIFLLFFVLAIAGCGGSGGSSSDDNGGGGNGGSGGGTVETACLCFTSSGSTVVSIRINGTLDNIPALEYSKNGLNWSPIALVNDSTVEVTALSDGEKVYLRAQNTNNLFSVNFANYIQFVFTGSGTIEASGNIMSLLDKTLGSTEIPCDRCFYRLFKKCTALTRAPNLPAVSLTAGCYQEMFNGCTSLANAPALPAEILADWCYQDMFFGCTSLVTAPNLPAITLANHCYSGMFFDCTSLVNAPNLPAKILATACYVGMFDGCTSLVNAPELSATTLADSCYSFMFIGCTNLNYIKVSFTSWGPQTKSWVQNVGGTGTFICPAALVTPSPKYGKDWIPTDWTVNP